MTDLRITNSQPVLPDGRVVDADVLVRDGMIEGLVSRDTPVFASRIVDGGGNILLPGLIDTHVHIGVFDPDVEAGTETASAALGGVTTTLQYFRSLSPYDEVFAAELERARASSYVDFAYHLVVQIEEHLDNLQRYAERWGIRSWKLYTCYKAAEKAKFGVRGANDGFMYDVFRKIAAMPDALAIVHCENDDIVERETRKLQSTGQGTMGDLEVWDRARPEIAEFEAVQRVALLAADAGCPLFVPHVSGARVLRLLEDRKATGQRIYVETLISYLALDHSAPAGGLATINPPIRGAGNAEALWDGVRRGTIDAIATDHYPTPASQKHLGAILGCPSGHPGLATLLPVMLSEGVHRARMEIGTIGRLQARAAKIFGLPRKGAIRPGADADLVLVDLDAIREVKGSELGSIVNYSPFEGMRLCGWPLWTMLRGRIIAEGGRLVGEPGYGRYLRE